MTLNGYLDVPAARLEAVRAALPRHVELTRAEPGCLQFDVVEATAPAGRFTVSERFADAAAFQAHQDRAAASDWGRITAGMPRSYTITGLPE